MTDHEEAAAIAEEQINEFCDQMKRELLRYGDPDEMAQMSLSTAEFRNILESNTDEWCVSNAAAGVTEAIVELRTRLGLPIFA